MSKPFMNELNKLRSILELHKNEIIDYLLSQDDYPYVCNFSYTYVYEILKNDYEVYKCSGDIDNMYHCWNEVFIQGNKIVIDFTRVQFDFSEMTNGHFIEYGNRLKNDYTLQKEYLITKDHVEFGRYVPIYKFNDEVSYEFR